ARGQEQGGRDSRTYFVANDVKDRRGRHDDHDATGGPGREPWLNPRQCRKGDADGSQDLRYTEEELKPTRERRVQLLSDRGRRNEKHDTVGQEHESQEYLQRPDNGVHGSRRAGRGWLSAGGKSGGRRRSAARDAP